MLARSAWPFPSVAVDARGLPIAMLSAGKRLGNNARNHAQLRQFKIFTPEMNSHHSIHTNCIYGMRRMLKEEHEKLGYGR